MTLEELEALEASPAATPPGQPAAPASSTTQKAPGQINLQDLEALDTAPPAPASSSGLTLDQLQSLEAPATATSPSPQPAPAQPAAPPKVTDPSAAPLPTVNGNAIDPAGQIGGAILTGAAKSLYETRDFIFGKTPESEKTDLRRSIEGLDRRLGEASMGNSFVSGLSQFATGMLGAGKLVAGSKLVPGVGGAVGALEATRKGSMVLSSAKAATVGAVAFDPDGPRLSDLVVLKGPAWLQNPVSSYLAHTGNEDDSAALGRMKNALESIGMDAAMAGVFALSVKGYAKVQAYRAGTGSPEAVQAATEELAHAMAHKDAKLAASKGDLETVEAIRLDRPEAVAQAERELAERQVAALVPEVRTEPSTTTSTTLPELSVAPGDPPSPSVMTPKGGQSTAPSPLLPITDDQVSRLIAHGQADTEQLLSAGGWEGALERGYKFGDGGGIPWQKLSIEPGTEPGTSQLDQVIRRVSDEFAGQIAAAKGGDGLGGVRSDAMQDRLIQQRVALYGDDAAALMGSLQLAGRNADRLVADVAAADLITLRASQDAQNLADRIRLGMLEEFDGDLSAAISALRGHYQVAATARAESSAMVANAARTLRRQRTEFAYTPEDVAAMGRLSDAQMLTLIESAGRDPRVADRLLRRGFWSRLTDDASYLFVNNLLWGLRTHFVNLSTNVYMMSARPLERMIGAAVQGDRARIAENARQFAYMTGSLHEAWRDAARTWMTGDSVLAPYSASELNAAAVGRSRNWVAEGYRQWDSVPNILSNAYVGFMKAAGLPTRALGAVDELVKQTVYRSKVMARAQGDGVAAGLEGPALSEHVRRTLDAAFDDAGRAVDLKALEEAQIATFSQDLLPGTIGAWVQQGPTSVPAMRFVLPFVKTPTNVIRMGVKLTPGLNMLQQEYRQMIRGQMGEEKQAQAIGQMAMGSLFLGTAATLAVQGRITGGGPSDPNLKRQLMATGWQPYSFVVPGADGSPTYVNFGRFDPIALPFGIVADIVDIFHLDQDGDGHREKGESAAAALLMAVSKQMAQKTYFSSLHDALNSLYDPDRNAAKVLGGMAANFVPASSGLRFVNPDPHLRETRGVVDRIMAGVPGLSERLPAQRDVLGDPLTVHKGLWVTGKAGLVDAEVRRMVDEGGVMFGPPATTHNGVDLRDVTMKDGRNAFAVFQELAGHPPRGPSLKQTLGRIMATKPYQNAPDGKAEDRGTRLAMVTGTISKYRAAGLRWLMQDPNVRQAMFQASAKGRAAVAARNAPKSDQQAGAAALERVGERFGVNLGGLLATE